MSPQIASGGEVLKRRRLISPIPLGWLACSIVLLPGNGKTVAEGYFEEPSKLRMTFPDHKSAFYQVSPDLNDRLIAVAQRHGHWR